MHEATADEHLSNTEETANIISHGIGVLLAIAALVVMVVKASATGDPWKITAVSVYGASLILLCSTSTVYHYADHPESKKFLRILDHSAIYVLIAGSYTPFTLVTLRGPMGWTLFGILWGLALAGIAFKSMWTGRYEWLSTALYVIMGWLGVIAVGPILQLLAPAAIGWLLAGGLFYTGGVVFFLWEKLPYHHLIWHLLVLAGAACHFVAVLLYVI